QHHHSAGDPHRAARGRADRLAGSRKIVRPSPPSPRHAAMTSDTRAGWSAMTVRVDKTVQRRSKTLRCEAAFAFLAVLFAGCYGDFGRPRQTIVSIDRADWIEVGAAGAAGVLPSTYPFTDEERLLRELAYS